MIFSHGHAVKEVVIIANKEIFASPRRWVVTITCPARNIRLTTANGRSNRDRVLLLVLFLRLSFVEIGFPRTDLFMVLSIDAKGIAPKFPLSRYTVVSPFCERLTWLSCNDAVDVLNFRINGYSLSIIEWS